MVVLVSLYCYDGVILWYMEKWRIFIGRQEGYIRLFRAFNIFEVYQYFTIFRWYFLLKFEEFSGMSYTTLFKIRRYQRPFRQVKVPLVPPLIETSDYLYGWSDMNIFITWLNIAFIFQSQHWFSILLRLSGLILVLIKKINMFFLEELTM